MFERRPRRRVTNALATLLLLAGGSGAWAQLPAVAEVPNPFPALPVPPVDLEGVWKIATPTNSLRPVSGSVPFTAEGRKLYDENRKLEALGKLDDYDITRSRCSTPGVPRLMLLPMRFKLWNRLGVVTFGFEWNQAIRQIDMRGVKTDPKLVPDMAGTSEGHWEGDVLVAVTNDFTGRTLWDRLMPQSPEATVVERFRLIDPDTLEDRVTINDPTNFTRTWDAVLTYKRQPAAFFAQDICLDRLKAHEPAIPGLAAFR